MTELKEVLHYYLPYKVMFKYQGQENEDDQFEMIGIDDGWVSGMFTDSNLIDDIAPILHPLSSVNKEQFHNFDFVEIMELKEGLRNIQSMHFSVIELCLKNHIDIFGLIKSDQAIEK